MASVDNAGRIPKDAFVISTSILYCVALLAIPARIFTRVRFPGVKLSKIDDAFLAIAICSITAALVILHVFTIDDMYLAEAVVLKMPGLEAPPDFVKRLLDFQKWVTVVLILSWCGIMAVKFSFLFFFRNLIRQVPRLGTYWWIVFIFNVCVLGYGSASYYLACPHYYSIKSLSCNAPSGMRRLFAHATTQMALDIAGDIMLLSIPLHIIWTRQHTTIPQNLALSLPLCTVTTFMLATAILRVSSIWHQGVVDMAWATYWIVISSEVGVLMSIATSVHICCVARRRERTPKEPSSTGTGAGAVDRMSRRVSRGLSQMRGSVVGLGRRSRGLSWSPGVLMERGEGEGKMGQVVNELGEIPSGRLTALEYLCEEDGERLLKGSAERSRASVVEVDGDNIGVAR